MPKGLKVMVVRARVKLPLAMAAILALSAMGALIPATMCASATLTLQSSSPAVLVDEDFVLTGNLSVPKTGTMTLLWSIDCYCFNHHQDLNMTDGQFSVVFSAGSNGSWYFKAVWAGDGEYTATQSNIVGVSVSQPPPQTANVTFSLAGIDEAVGAVLYVEDTNYTTAQLPLTFTWEVGSEHFYTWYSPVGSGASQYEWASTSGLSTMQFRSLSIEAGGGSVAATYRPYSPPNRLPVPVISMHPTVLWTGLYITFDASSSHDADGTIASYAWDFGDLTSSNNAIATHSYGSPGFYIVTLTVVDDKGAEGRTSTTVEVVGAFRLNVTSNVGIVMEGSGTYPTGSVVQVSAPADAPVPGMMGVLGSRYVFQQWTGAVNSAQRTVSVVVDYQASQQGMQAVYQEQNTAAMMTIAAIGAVAIIAGALLTLVVVWKKKTPMRYALAMIVVIVGIVGTVMGFTYGQQYWADTGHPVVFSYGQLATIVGPIVAIIGVALFAVSWKVLKK